MLIDKLKIGYIDIPSDYWEIGEEKKKEMCEKILDKLYRYVDKNLDPTVDRISFLHAILDSSLESNVEYENYEVAAIIKDCKQILNES